MVQASVTKRWPKKAEKATENHFLGYSYQSLVEYCQPQTENMQAKIYIYD